MSDALLSIANIQIACQAKSAAIRNSGKAENQEPEEREIETPENRIKALGRWVARKNGIIHRRLEKDQESADNVGCQSLCPWTF
jgi:hypothetical protein